METRSPRKGHGQKPASIRLKAGYPMKSKKPSSNKVPGKKSRSVMALAALSASACSCRRIDTALALRDCRTRAPSVPASCSVADNSINSGTASSRPNSLSASHAVSPVSRARSNAFDIRFAAQSELTADADNRLPSIPAPPARLRTTRSTYDPTTIRKCCLRSLASPFRIRNGIAVPVGIMTRASNTGKSTDVETPAASAPTQSTGGANTPMPAATITRDAS